MLALLLLHCCLHCCLHWSFPWPLLPLPWWYPWAHVDVESFDQIHPLRWHRSAENPSTATPLVTNSNDVVPCCGHHSHSHSHSHSHHFHHHHHSPSVESTKQGPDPNSSFSNGRRPFDFCEYAAHLSPRHRVANKTKDHYVAASVGWKKWMPCWQFQ